MKTLIFFLALLVNFSLYSQNNVVVNGKTNVNTFKCFNANFSQQSNTYSFKKNQLPFLQLEVNNFDCGNKIMTKDMKTTLQASKYPKMFVKFLSFVKVSNTQYNAKIEVKLTDKTRYYETPFYPAGSNLVGKEYVKFSDFGLKAPTKMGGMIVVEDQLTLVLTLKNH